MACNNSLFLSKTLNFNHGSYLQNSLGLINSYFNISTKMTERSRKMTYVLFAKPISKPTNVWVDLILEKGEGYTDSTHEHVSK